jgi:predicted transcriptional regulator
VQKVSVQSQLRRWDHAAATVIAASRRDAGLTQTQLAEAMGVKRSVIARLEAGERPLRFSEFMVLVFIPFRAQRLQPLPPKVSLRHRDAVRSADTCRNIFMIPTSATSARAGRPQ